MVCERSVCPNRFQPSTLNPQLSTHLPTNVISPAIRRDQTADAARGVATRQRSERRGTVSLVDPRRVRDISIRSGIVGGGAVGGGRPLADAPDVAAHHIDPRLVVPAANGLVGVGSRVLQHAWPMVDDAGPVG